MRFPDIFFIFFLQFKCAHQSYWQWCGSLWCFISFLLFYESLNKPVFLFGLCEHLVHSSSPRDLEQWGSDAAMQRYPWRHANSCSPRQSLLNQREWMDSRVTFFFLLQVSADRNFLFFVPECLNGFWTWSLKNHRSIFAPQKLFSVIYQLLLDLNKNKKSLLLFLYLPWNFTFSFPAQRKTSNAFVLDCN